MMTFRSHTDSACLARSCSPVQASIGSSKGTALIALVLDVWCAVTQTQATGRCMLRAASGTAIPGMGKRWEHPSVSAVVRKPDGSPARKAT